jgi:hypothetical protein
MAEQRDTSTERYETVDPRNPPNSVLRPEVRTAALWAYLGPLIAVAVVVLIALLYWANRDGAPGEDVSPTIGTSGDTRPGGNDPAPRPDSTNEELGDRGRR